MAMTIIISIDGVEFTGKTAASKALVAELSAMLVHALPPPMELDMRSPPDIAASFDYYLSENLAIGRQLASFTKEMPDLAFVIDRLYSTEATHLALDRLRCGGKNEDSMRRKLAAAAPSMPQPNLAIFLYVTAAERRVRAQEHLATHQYLQSKDRYFDEPLAMRTQDNLREIAKRLQRNGKTRVAEFDSLPASQLSEAVIAVARSRPSAQRAAVRVR